MLLQVGSETDVFEQTPIYESTTFDIESQDTEDESSDENEEETAEPAEDEETPEEDGGSESESTADISYIGMDNNTLYYDVTVSGNLEVTLAGDNSWVSLSDDAGNTYAYEELSEGEYEIA